LPRVPAEIDGVAALPIRDKPATQPAAPPRVPATRRQAVSYSPITVFPSPWDRNMRATEPLVDIHCHLLPELDDGARNWHEASLMARMAVADGVRTIVATARQLGVYAHNHGDVIRQRTRELNAWLAAEEIDVRVVPGAYAYCEDELAD